jgi:exodeoxyribonuclease VII small subunit
LTVLSPNPDRGTRAEAPRSFESTFRELEQVVGELEDGRLELERAVALYERASELVRACERIVDDAELRVTRLASESASPLADAGPEQ